ncbi:MAG TPA: hypothetical protein VIY48_12460 [Candidatus Paceibacterota bacterium]
MPLYELDYYNGATREMLQDDKPRDETYAKIDDAHRSRFTNPKELRDLPWIGERRFVTTAPADALNAAIRTFASRMPRINIQPLSDAPEEYDRVEQHEEIMRWDFTRMNLIGKKSPHWKIVEYAMKYCAVAIETSYLPWLYKDKADDPRIKEILRSRQFRWNVHDPSNVHVRESDDTLECVVTCEVLPAIQIRDKFGADNPGVQQMLREIADKDKDPRALYTTFFSVYDYTDWQARVKWIARSPGKTLNREPSGGIEIMRQERTVSFLPWVYVDNEEPILKQMIDAELWDNVNILRTMQFSKAVDMAAHPEYWIQTPDGTLRGVTIDGKNPNQPLVAGPGVTVNKLIPPQIDPQMSAITQEAEQEVFRTTVAQILASVEKYAGTQNFSVVNAMLSAAVAQLSLAQMAAERAETQAMIQNFRWIDETEIPMVGFRTVTKGEGRERGKEIVIRKGDFDPDYLYLTVKLNPATVMDTQTEINNAINKVERLGMSMQMAWDDLNMENYDLSETQKVEEMLYMAHAQAKAKEIMQQPDIAAKQMLQAGAGQPQGNPSPGGPQSQFAGQQGMDMRGGGSALGIPGQGAPQLTGQSATGQGIP